MRALTSYGTFPNQAVQMWCMVRKREYPPMGGDPWWVIQWDVFDQLYAAEHSACEGIDRADALEAMLICEREANSDPKTWSELTGWAEA